MSKLWSSRKGLETIIGGLIVLILLLLSLVAMTVLTRQYDVYQGTVATMQQENTNKYAENIQAILPGIATNLPGIASPFCGGGSCNTYDIILDNLGIGVQIAAIYINSTQQPGCTTPCVLTPSSSSAPSKFSARQGYINAGEYSHGLVFWLQSSITLPRQCTVGGVLINYNCNTITLVTSRGRSFSFQWPIPPAGPPPQTGGGGGGTGLYIGPLVYTYQRGLVGYTTSANCNGPVSDPCTPVIPIGGTNGYWVVPSGTVIIYVKLEADVGVQNDIYLTPNSVMELEVYTSPGQSPASGSIVAPITPTLCAHFAAQDSTIKCDTTYGGTGYGYYAAGNTGAPGTPVQYKVCTPQQTPPNYGKCDTPRYRIPKPNPTQLTKKLRGDPVIVAFSFAAGSAINSNWPDNSVLTFLGLTYVWDDGTGAYVYGVTLPFVALCIDNGSNKCPG